MPTNPVAGPVTPGIAILRAEMAWQVPVHKTGPETRRVPPKTKAQRAPNSPQPPPPSAPPCTRPRAG